jgi:hypothetical protein
MAEITRGSISRPFTCTGAPTSGATGTFYGSAPAGAMLVDETNGHWYQNTNTLASPTWSRVSVARPIAASNVLGGADLIFRFDLAAGALADTDIVTTDAIRVIDAYLVLRGAGVATTTLTVKNASNAITDTMAASGSDKAIVRAATLDDAYWEIAAGGTLRVTSATGATQPEATVYVIAHRVA